MFAQEIPYQIISYFFSNCEEFLSSSFCILWRARCLGGGREWKATTYSNNFLPLNIENNRNLLLPLSKIRITKQTGRKHKSTHFPQSPFTGWKAKWWWSDWSLLMQLPFSCGNLSSFWTPELERKLKWLWSSNCGYFTQSITVFHNVLFGAGVEAVKASGIPLLQI